MAYSGKIVCFGENVLARVRPSNKGEARFVSGCWLSKVGHQDMRCVSTSSGGLIVTCTIRRVAQQWNANLLRTTAGFTWLNPGIVAGCVSASRMPKTCAAVLLADASL